jgi:molecular chaperone GrpE (heat shock protein)
LSEEKGVRFLTTAVNELRRIGPEIANLRDDVETQVKEDFLKQLFPVIDAFDRFFAQEKESQDPRIQSWLEGIRGIYNSVLMIFRNHEVKEIPARGIFNPKFQAAVGTEIDNELPPGTIIRTERRGFIMGKKILRTPEVIVTKRTDLVE